MVENHKARMVAGGVLALVVAVVATSFALGGSKAGSSHPSKAAGLVPPASGSATTTAPVVGGPQSGGDQASVNASGGGGSPAYSGSASVNGGVTHAAAAAPEVAPASSATGSVTGSVTGSAIDAADGVTATKVIKTGSLSLQVPKGQVSTTITRLTALTNQSGGYVSQSRTDDELGSPTGELTLRIPAGAFDPTVTAAERLGHVTSLTTGSKDVTGRFVDLGARLDALEQTRTTYLTILGRARTIGSTLQVQQHVDDVQQQIEELQGELKVLRNQSADGTLTVDVTQVGAVVVKPHRHHAATGIGHAWHTSVGRFNRGFYSIIGALGPLLLVLLVLLFVAALGGLGYRGIRRAIT